jgi:hypothetical protein
LHAKWQPRSASTDTRRDAHGDNQQSSYYCDYSHRLLSWASSFQGRLDTTHVAPRN